MATTLQGNASYNISDIANVEALVELESQSDRGGARGGVGGYSPPLEHASPC